jgi:GDP-L-fucose synthase
MEFLTGKKVLVTGAAGLVGTHMLQRLIKVPGIDVRGVYHRREPFLKADNLSYVQADLTDKGVCRSIVKGVDVVFMFAAQIARQSPRRDYIVANLLMNLYMLEAAYEEGVKKVLWLSSATAYPASPLAMKEEAMFNGDPADSYFLLGWTSRYVETMYRMYATKLNPPMTAIVLRPTAIYGEYADFDLASAHVLCALIRKAVERHNPLEVWGAAEVYRDFIYIGDVIDACLLAIEKIEGFSTLNIGLGKTSSIKEILEIILQHTGYPLSQVLFKPASGKKAACISVDITKAKEVLGFVPRVSLGEGIAKTIDWLKLNLAK